MGWGYNVYAKIIGYNVYGPSALSNAGSEAVILTKPDAPVSIMETESERSITSITFSWSDGLSDGGAPIIDYRISYDNALSAWEVRAENVQTKSYTATGLTAGLTYKFRIEARNSYDHSDYSDEISIICATIPSVPAQPTTSNV